MNFKPLQVIFVYSLITMFKALLLFLISPLFIGILHILIINSISSLLIVPVGFRDGPENYESIPYHSILSSGAIWLYALQYKQPQAGDKSFYLPADSLQPAW